MATRASARRVLVSAAGLGSVLCLALPVGAHAKALADPNSSPLGVHDLYDLSALSATDAWAVGSLSHDGSTYETWIQHWDGERWDCVGSHSGTGLQNSLHGVATVAPDDVWAVGAAQAADDNAAHTLIEHWDGSRWAVLPSPAPTRVSELRGVTVVAANDLWAVGSSARGALTLHYDGARWRQVDAAPRSPSSSTLRDVTALAPDDVWAVGSAGKGAATTPIAQRWDGKRWSSYDVPAPAGSHLVSVSGTASDDVWAVGVTTTASGGARTLTEHWNGSEWAVVTSPNGDQSVSTLTAVTAIAPGDAWAVGFRGNDRRTATLAEHWDGAGWSVVDSANGSPTANHMYGVAATSPSDVLTVGSYDVHGKDRALTERWDGTSWSITP